MSESFLMNILRHSVYVITVLNSNCMYVRRLVNLIIIVKNVIVKVTLELAVKSSCSTNVKYETTGYYRLRDVCVVRPQGSFPLMYLILWRVIVPCPCLFLKKIFPD